jgi:hypothetical protein
MNPNSFEPGQDKITTDVEDTEGHATRGKGFVEDDDTEGHAIKSGRIVADEGDDDVEGHGVRIKI